MLDRPALPPLLQDVKRDLAAAAFEAAVALTQCDTVEEVSNLYQAIIQQLGMTASASGMVSGPRATSGNPFHFVNWPPAWMKHYQKNNYAKIDPIPRWAIISGAAVSFSEIRTALPPRDPGQEVYRAASAWGYTEGFVTPVRTVDGDLGLLSVAGDRGDLSLEERLFLQTISTAALQRANSLMAAPRDVSGSVLSQREKECVHLLAQGLTDREISKVLTISTATTRFHIDNARRKLGARSRAQLTLMMSGLPE